MSSSKKIQNKEKKNSQPTPLSIEVDYSNRIPATYANYAAVSHSVNEFFIDFCILAPPYNMNNMKAEGPVVYAQPITRIIIPVSMAPGLIEALQAQVEKQKETQKSQSTELGPQPDGEI